MSSKKQSTKNTLNASKTIGSDVQNQLKRNKSKKRFRI